MRPALLLVLPVLLTVACKRPELEAFRAQPTPVTVAYTVSPSVPGYQALEREYAAALRARLATRVEVVPEGAQGPPRPVLVTVWIRDMELRQPVSPGEVGVATGLGVTAVGLLVGNRNAAFDGFFWGLWAAGRAAEEGRSARFENRVLGYRPHQMTARIMVTQDGVRQPFCELDVDAREVVDAMDPLRGSDRDDEVRIREEEAKAMARVVVGKLQDRFGWTAKPAPTFYQPERNPSPAPVAPAAPAPADAPPAPADAPAAPAAPAPAR